MSVVQIPAIRQLRYYDTVSIVPVYQWGNIPSSIPDHIPDSGMNQILQIAEIRDYIVKLFRFPLSNKCTQYAVSILH